MTITQRFVHAILSGMVILVLPSLVVCTVVAIVAWRRRDGEADRD